MTMDRTPSGLVYGIVVEVTEKPRCLKAHPMSQPAARQMDVLLCYKQHCLTSQHWPIRVHRVTMGFSKDETNPDTGKETELFTT